nr:MAG TPA: Rad50 zinc hook motif [Caudoviricetes sp.]
MKKCTGENCPMQIGYDVENCAAIEKCPYCTRPVTIADLIRSTTDNEPPRFCTISEWISSRNASLVFRHAKQIGMKLKNGLKPRGRASRERGSEWRKCDGKTDIPR